MGCITSGLGGAPPVTWPCIPNRLSIRDQVSQQFMRAGFLVRHSSAEQTVPPSRGLICWGDVVCFSNRPPHFVPEKTFDVDESCLDLIQDCHVATS